MRIKGSCRFKPYYKVQWRDPVAMCWREIQKAHPTEKEARTAAPITKQTRIQKVTEKGREIL